MKTSIKLTVFFDGVFWCGLFENTYGEKYEVSKVVFGAEPKDSEIYQFILKNFYKVKFSDPLLIEEVKEKKINPKRQQRQIKKEVKNKEIGTKAQIAMKKQHESTKRTRRIFVKAKKEEEKKKKFELKQKKKKIKHRGH